MTTALSILSELEHLLQQNACEPALELCEKLRQALEGMRGLSQEQLESVISEIKTLADRCYCQGLEIHTKPECLGFDYKIENGKLKKENYEAIVAGTDKIAWHFALYNAIEIIHSAFPELFKKE